MVLAFESSRVLRCSDPLSLFLSLRIGPTLFDRIIQLGTSSLRTLLLGREKFLMRFEFHRVLLVRICNN